MEKATSISIKLANKAYIHLLTALELTIKSTIEPYIETNCHGMEAVAIEHMYSRSL